MPSRRQRERTPGRRMSAGVRPWNLSIRNGRSSSLQGEFAAFLEPLREPGVESLVVSVVEALAVRSGGRPDAPLGKGDPASPGRLAAKGGTRGSAPAFAPDSACGPLRRGALALRGTRLRANAASSTAFDALASLHSRSQPFDSARRRGARIAARRPAGGRPRSPWRSPRYSRRCRPGGRLRRSRPAPALERERGLRSAFGTDGRRLSRGSVPPFPRPPTSSRPSARRRGPPSASGNLPFASSD